MNIANSSNRAYHPSQLEAKWQERWVETNQNQTKIPDKDQKTFYALSMFHYPSGNLHMGHVRNYVITDVISRMQKMMGKAVLHPMGWDAFGLPAENAAIERGISPEIWTEKNIKHMRLQLKRLGLSIDWNKEIKTCSKEYYKWTQYIFLELYKAGLAYQKKATVNWDPIDKTVLANEQVDIEGKSWRSGAKVQQKELTQWFIKITDFSEDLLSDLDQLNGWPERVKLMQKNWIGKSEGTEIDFKLENPINGFEYIKVFTTRVDTLFGTTYIVLAPENKLIKEINKIYKSKDINTYLEEIHKLTHIQRKDESKDSIGINLGIYAIHPFTQERLPIYSADYVIGGYGTGAVMAVPAHDKRDFNFAKKYNIGINYVIESKIENIDYKNSPYLDKGILVNSNQFTGLYSDKAKIEITKELARLKLGRKKTQYRLRDWLISRQRYWGCPIPIIHCKSCGPTEVPVEALPIQLSRDISNTEISSICPKCGSKAKKETDTMDTFMCSSWYFLRYTDSINKKEIFSKSEVDRWMPVDQYVGGIEHAILHLLYSRFLTKFLYKRNLISTKEPFKKLLTQGMVQAITYKNNNTGKYIDPKDILDPKDVIDPKTGEKLDILYEKMSKSKYNGVDPSIVIDKYGADTARMFILFKAPPEKDLEWDDADVEGQYRFLNRLWKLVEEWKTNKCFTINSNINSKELSKSSSELRKAVHLCIKNITQDLTEGQQFNTAISEIMKLSNAMNDLLDKVEPYIIKEAFITIIKLLAPFAPHIAEEFWLEIGESGSIHNQNWPLFDPMALKSNTYNLMIQIMGKVRGSIEIPVNTSKEEIEKQALASEVSKKWINNNRPKRIIIVPGKLINFVL